jgi:hypothetical protein
MGMPVCFRGAALGSPHLGYRITVQALIPFGGGEVLSVQVDLCGKCKADAAIENAAAYARKNVPPAATS